MEKTSEARTNLSKYDNSWYRPGPLPKRVLWLLIGRLTINTYLPIPLSFKIFVLRAFGAIIGENVMIKPKVNIKYPWFLTIGENSWIGEKVWIDNLSQVTIGTDCCLSQGAMLLTGNHNYKSTLFDLRVSPILLEDGVWVGALSVVCPGVVCETHSVLTVSSVATAPLKAYGIYAGNPAVLVRKRVFEK